MKYLFFVFILLNYTVIHSQHLDTSPKVKQMASGSGHSIALLDNGTLWAWGRNTAGQLGDGSWKDKYIPVMIGTYSNWQSVTAGTSFSHAIKTDGTLWGWGNNKVGQLGINTTNGKDDLSKPVQIGLDADWQAVSACNSYTAGLKKDGSIWVWGSNLSAVFYQPINQYKPVKIIDDDNTGWNAIAAGENFLIALKKDGTLYTRGVLNETMHIKRKKDVFYKVSDDTTWVSFAAGKQHGVAIKRDGSLWTWGKNDVGQLGFGDISSTINPILISRYRTWKSVSASGDYNIAIKKDGSVWYWGVTGFMKEHDQNSSVPQQFDPSTKYKCISAGSKSLLLSFEKENLRGIIKYFSLGENGTFKSFIK